MTTLHEDLKALRDALSEVADLGAHEAVTSTLVRSVWCDACDPARIARLLAAVETTRDALREVLGCPYVIEEATVPSSGLDTPGLNLFQVVGTMHVALPRYRALKAALAQFEQKTNG